MKSVSQNRDYWPDPPDKPPVGSIEIVPMTLDQVYDVLEIEQDSFPTPWTIKAFEYDLTQNDFAHYWVLLRDGKIIGYAGLWLMGNLGHLTTICIEKSHRGKGLGKWLLLKTMKMGEELGAQRFTLEVRETNEPAIGLYENVGYRTVGRRANYYREIDEDALVMWTGDPPYDD